ncbi:hypothetical protein [Corallococcus sp. RDP092CA]|uniref:hypothetical protein n=1 Tax=Corallococcus sp. RDP092CA TaxID=3109369 RepID=UPI0035AF6447
MAWGMSFERDVENDVVTATFTDCILVTDEDVQRWRRDVEAQFAKFNGRVDLLINLDGLIVRHTAGRTFGKVRREVLERNTHRSFRYGGDETTLVFINTSGAINGAAVNHYPTREAALAALLAERDSLRKRGFTPFLPGVVNSKP